jgi:transposase
MPSAHDRSRDHYAGSQQLAHERTSEGDRHRGGVRPHAVLVCDGAGWHQSGDRLEVPDNITLLPLPPYSPELNPMENGWDYLRGNKLSHKVVTATTRSSGHAPRPGAS